MVEYESITVEPDPKRLIEGLRDTGYDFVTAIADIVDNSIAAYATKISIKVEMDFQGNIVISIADNGIGMDYDELIQAMKYGSPPRVNPRSLGKFGLGLKTASTAFCKKLSVISQKGSDISSHKAIWDLNHVATVGKWDLLMTSVNINELGLLGEVMDEGHGTLVLWEEVDRLIKEYTDPSGGSAKRAVKKHISELKSHLETVYKRFIDINDEREKQKISISLNGEELGFWDPFCIGESELVASEVVPIRYEDDDQILGEFELNAYVLPRKGQFSTPEAEQNAKIGNNRQGFYIFRENRLIHYADWLGMYSNEPHGSLLRVEFSFNSDLDEALQVDIKKSQIGLASEMYDWIKNNFLPGPRKAADDLYRKGVKAGIDKVSTDAHEYSNKSIGTNSQDIKKPEITIQNPDTGEVKINNTSGVSVLKIKIGHANKPGEFYVQPVDQIDNGLLWQAAYIDNHPAVQINKGHPFYSKVYIPNIQSSTKSNITVQGLDTLFWAIAIAELNAVNSDVKDYFDDLRYDASRSLRKLVEDLPDPDIE